MSTGLVGFIIQILLSSKRNELMKNCFRVCVLSVVEKDILEVPKQHRPIGKEPNETREARFAVYLLGFIETGRHFQEGPGLIRGALSFSG